MEKKKKGIEWYLFGLALTILSLIVYYLTKNNEIAGWILAIICFGYFVCLSSGHGVLLTIVTTLLTLLLIFVISLLVFVSSAGAELVSCFQTCCMLLPIFRIILFFIYLIS